MTVELGTPEQFASLRALLDDAGYTASRIAERIGISSVYHFPQIRDGRTDATETNDALDVLVRLFMDIEMVEERLVHRLLPKQGLSALQTLGLLSRSRSAPDHYQANVLLYPAGTASELGAGFPEIYLVSDLTADPDPAHRATLQPDAVYPALTMSTGAFLTFLPRTACERFLELCSGTGIAALLASRFAKRSWAVDITERSTRFAEFNRRLNQVTNVEVLRGDLYEPVAGLTFDRIVAHPPYVPASEQHLIYRDGGVDGEEITARLIAGLPRYLEPGGRCYCVCRATDRAGASLERRVRRMLGERESEFDVLVVAISEDAPLALYGREIASGTLTLAEAESRLEVFRRLEVERSVHALIVVQRVKGTRPVFTERRDVGKIAASTAVEWLLDWEAAARHPRAADQLLGARPRVAEEADLQLLHHRRNGAWESVGCEMSTSWPFSLKVQAPTWAAGLLDRCDGQKTARELLASLVSTGVLAGDGSEELFLNGLHRMVSAGVLLLDHIPLPARSVRMESGLQSPPPATWSAPIPPPKSAPDRTPPVPGGEVPRVGTREEFAVLAACLDRAGYDEARVCERLGFARIYEFRTLRDGRPGSPAITDLPDALIRLFMDAEQVPWVQVRQYLTGPEVSAFEAMRLLQSAPDRPDLCQATVLLYPTEGLHVISDLHASPDPASGPPMREDSVYPAITKNTGHFLAALPETSCDAMLDLCAGSGIAALVQASRCGHVWATDLTERSTRFARFNALLNGIENLTAVQGDLYAPVAGRTFDRIVAHPPYVASRERRMIYRDGGRDGEEISRRIVEELPAYLRPGGRFYATAVLSDRKGAPVEARLRTFLGAAADQFDVVVFVRGEQSPEAVIGHRASVGALNADELRESLHTLRELGVEQFVYCSLVLQRVRQARSVCTVRRSLPLHSPAAVADWVLAWEETNRRPEFADRLWDARPTAPADAKIEITNRRDTKGWVAEGCTVLAGWPFKIGVRCPPAGAELLVRSDGQVTLRQHFRSLRDAGLIASEVRDEDFLDLAKLLVSAGALRIEGFLPPPRPASGGKGGWGFLDSPWSGG